MKHIFGLKKQNPNLKNLMTQSNGQISAESFKSIQDLSCFPVAVNGFMYGNLPGLEMNKESMVRWHLMGLGTEMDMHGIYFQGNTFQRQGTTRDTLGLFPHTTVTVSMQPDVSGQYIYLYTNKHK